MHEIKERSLAIEPSWFTSDLPLDSKFLDIVFL
jgi:hypothetical protein